PFFVYTFRMQGKNKTIGKDEIPATFTKRASEKSYAPLDKFDTEEIEILEAAEKNILITVNESLDKYQQVAKNTIMTNKRTSTAIDEKRFPKDPGGT
ncbi:MAG TPA: hypothetical protein PLO55_13295, partial [Thermotogota bacterium]|nr:hypothetical protein [Thermotogota bacterium]